MSLSKGTSILLYILMGISAVLVILFYFGPVVPGTENTSMEEPKITEIILRWGYFLMAVTAAITIIFSIVNIFINPQNAKKTGFVILGALVLIIIAYTQASDKVMSINGYDGPDNVPTTLKIVGTGLITAYLLGALAVVSIIYSEIAKLFK
ncbi:MAG TPA: hypothetical protein VE912_24610 [Bacteroidales bacterium]|nr:hypothetical protein [Bacteroidales bacterium]